MNQFYKEYEMLSAYIDGELTTEEQNYIEDKLALSKDLQQKLSELKRIKELSQSSFKRAAESPYFETKLIANLSSENKGAVKFRKWIPVLGISLATVVLMLFLKSNPQFFESIIEEQKSKLAGLYTENLKPLFVTAGLTNEDVFNFALYRKLPLDKERGQYIQLGTNNDGSDFFEIKTIADIDAKNDFEKFVSVLNLNDKQKIKMDSILESYADGMQDQILVNENNTVAISPKLWNYNKAIFADLMAFAEDVNRGQFTKIVPAEIREIDAPKLAKLAHVVRTAQDSDYIFMTPDTIFVESFRFDREKFRHDREKLRVDLDKNLKETHEKMKQQQDLVIKLDDNIVKLKSKGRFNKNFEVIVDTNLFRVHVPNINFNWSEVTPPNLDELEAQIEAATKNLQSFTIRIPKEGSIKRKFEVRVDVGDSTQKFNFDLDLPKLKKQVFPGELLKDSSLFNSGIYSLKADSLSEAIRKMLNDSGVFNQNEFKFQMKEFQKEMQKLREEMLRLQKNLQKEENKGNKEEVIEI